MTNNAASALIHRIENDGTTLVLERVFDAPRALVFEAFSKAEHLRNWFSPKGWSTTVCNVDFRVGGVWHFCMKCTDESKEYYGQESWSKVVYQEIDEPNRIVYTDSFSDAEGNINLTMPTTLIEMTFIEHDGKTKLISRTIYATAEMLKSILDMGVLMGISQTWDKLADLLERLQNE